MPRPKRNQTKAQHRPLKKIEWNEVDRLLIAGCTGPQIAGYLGISVDTLYDRTHTDQGVCFSEYKQQKLSCGDALLATKQFEDALGLSKVKGNVQLLLRLGEFRLGQKNESSDGNQARAFVSLYQRLERLEAAALARGISLSELEAKQPVLDQGLGGEKDQVQPELGAEGTSTESPLQQHNPEG